MQDALGFSSGAADSKAWKLMEDVLAKASNCSCSTREEKERALLEICMWDESHQPPLSIPCPTLASTSAPRKEVRAQRGQVSTSLPFTLCHGYPFQLSSSVNEQPKTGPGAG